jgi:hypothetical protein
MTDRHCGPTQQIVRHPRKPRSARFECADCGLQRRNSERLLCLICGDTVCDWCEDTHLRQHPREAWLR